jgi:hypothetical protein
VSKLEYTFFFRTTDSFIRFSPYIDYEIQLPEELRTELSTDLRADLRTDLGTQLQTRTNDGWTVSLKIQCGPDTKLTIYVDTTSIGTIFFYSLDKRKSIIPKCEDRLARFSLNIVLIKLRSTYIYIALRLCPNFCLLRSFRNTTYKYDNS